MEAAKVSWGKSVSVLDAPVGEKFDRGLTIPIA
jgi:hypothetical protein